MFRDGFYSSFIIISIGGSKFESVSRTVCPIKTPETTRVADDGRRLFIRFVSVGGEEEEEEGEL